MYAMALISLQAVTLQGVKRLMHLECEKVVGVVDIKEQANLHSPLGKDRQEQYRREQLERK